jgi:hypothetical protein
MNVEGKLILDNSAHKYSVTMDGKQQKITIAPFNDLSITSANNVVNDANEIIKTNYNFYQTIRMYEVAVALPGVTRYSLKAIEIVIKLLYQNELNDYIENKKKQGEQPEVCLVVLNIGCTSAGKTLGNLHALIPEKYVKKFLPLTSIKESTNFTIYYYMNCIKGMSFEEFTLEFQLKSSNHIRDDIKSLILEAIQEIFDTIKTEIKHEKSDDVLWNNALQAGQERIKVNKNKTFDLSSSIELNDIKEILETIVLKAVKEYATQSSSYNRFSDEQIKNGIISDIREDVFKIGVDELAYIICKLEKFICLLEDIERQLVELVNKFETLYGVTLGDGGKATIRKEFNNLDTKKLISNVFGDKKQRKDPEYFSIDVLVQEAKIYINNDKVNDGKQLIIVDGLGINQGQITKGLEKQEAYNRVHRSIQMCNPDIIVYNTRIDNKDDYIVDVLKDLSEQGYKNSVFVTYSRIDEVLESYCEDGDIDISDISEQEFDEFERYIDTEYIEKELISLKTVTKDKVFLCDKPCKLRKYDNNYFLKYAPEQVLKKVLDIFVLGENSKKLQLEGIKVTNTLQALDDCNIFNNAFKAFIDSIDEMVPMQYQKLRWNTLECAIRDLYYDGMGFSSLCPSLTLKYCFAQLLNCDEVKNALNDDYDRVLKLLLNEWISIAQVLMVTCYKVDYSKLLNMRYDNSLRMMRMLTLTDERKYVVKNILSTCFKNGTLMGPEVFRRVTEYVLKNINQ